MATNNVNPKSPSCPKCGGMMVVRSRKSDGKRFWGCRLFPACNGTMNYDEESNKFNDAWALHKNEFAARETEQEKQAFLSDPDYQHAFPKIETEAIVKVDYAAVELKAAAFTWSEKQIAIFRWAGENLFIEARAGTGKTTTIAQCTKLLPRHKRIVVLVFNKHNVQPIKDKVPDYVKVCTDHALGNAACRKEWPDFVVDEYLEKVPAIINQLLNKDMYGYLFGTIKQLVSLVKANLSGTTDEDLLDLVDHYGIETNGDADLIFQAVRETIERCKLDTKLIDYDDMIWLPVVHKINVAKYDYIYLDEAQDTNKCQIAFIKLSLAPEGHLIAVGDRYQSMYGFRGADANAVPNIVDGFGAEVLPLDTTYRNPECIVQLVNEKFPEISFEGTGKAGTISNLTYEQALIAYKPGDMVLCRTNAPLVPPVFELIRRGVKATIRGRNIGEGLLSLIKKMKTDDISTLLRKLSEYKMAEVEKLAAADKNPQSLMDKVETIVALCDGVSTVFDLENRINNIFSEKVEGVVFSSIHRAKGLEAERVFIIGPDLLPHPMAKKDWEKEQERNIEYVAITRTLRELIYVPQKKGQ